LMGQSVLKTHLIDGTKHYPYGWYGVFDNDFALPVDNLGHLIRFCEDLNLDRFGKSGLSMVIPFPDPTIEAKEIVSSTLIHYIAPILSGDLVVDVVDKDTRVTIDKVRIEKHISLMDFSTKKFTQESFGALIQLMRWAIDLPEKNYVRLKEGESGKAAKWSEKLFEPHILKTLRRQLEERRPIALRVPMEVQKKNGPVQQTHFDVFIQRDDDLDRAEDHFIREGITLAGVKSLRQKGIRAIIWVKDKALSSMLGDSENPAHTEWQERSPKFAGRYVRGTSALRFVKNSPKELINILYRPEQVIEEDPLLKFDMRYPASGITMKPFQDNFMSPLQSSQKSPLPFLAEDKDFHLLRIDKGFKVTLHPECSIPPSGILVSTAYEVRRGNPFSKYSIFDFDMGKSPIKIKTGGGRIVAKKLNRLFIEIRRSNFFIEVTGFDANRDLRIKINPVR